MTRFTHVAAALSVLVLPAATALAGASEGGLQPATHALGVSGPSTTIKPYAVQFNGNDAETVAGRPAARVEGPADPRLSISVNKSSEGGAG